MLNLQLMVLNFMISIKKRYSPAGLFQLFLISSLPIHVWTLLLSFRDISTFTERTNLNDAIGVVCYGLVFAFFESLFVFSLFTLLGFLISTLWDEHTRLTLLNTLVIILGTWAVLGQVYVFFDYPMPSFLFNYLLHAAHPARVFYGTILGSIALSLSLPSLLILKHKTSFQFFKKIHDGLSVLAGFYLSLDVFALIIIIFRNI
jgi:hypothetical protein